LSKSRRRKRDGVVREIEIEVGEGWWIVLLPVILLVSVGLALLGRQVSPEGGGVLTPARWNLLKEERAYDKELGILRDDVEELVRLMNGGPNPVEAGLAADRIQYETLDGHPALALQREALANATEMVRLWSMGGAMREEAEVALEEAVSLLEGEH
jgi:hypothetical protein